MMVIRYVSGEIAGYAASKLYKSVVSGYEDEKDLNAVSANLTGDFATYKENREDAVVLTEVPVSEIGYAPEPMVEEAVPESMEL